MTDDVKIPIEVDVDGAVSRIRDFGKAAETLAGNFESLGGATEKAAKAMAALVASHKVLASTRLNQAIYEINRYEQAIRKAAQAGQGLPGFGGGGGASSTTASAATGGTWAAPMSPSSTPQRTAPYQDSLGRWHHSNGRFMAGGGDAALPGMAGIAGMRKYLGMLGIATSVYGVASAGWSATREGASWQEQLDPLWRSMGGSRASFGGLQNGITGVGIGLQTGAAESLKYASQFARGTLDTSRDALIGGTRAGIGLSVGAGMDREIGVAAAAAMDRWLKDKGGWKQTGALLAQGLVESHSLQQAGEIVGQFTTWLKSTGGSGAAPNADAYWDWITKFSQTKSPAAMGAEGGALLQQMDAGFRSNMDNPAFMAVFDRALKSQGINKDVYGIRRLLDRGGLAEVGGPGSGTISSMEAFVKQFQAENSWMSEDRMAENIASLFGISRDQAATFLSAAANPGSGHGMLKRLRGTKLDGISPDAWIGLERLDATPTEGLNEFYGSIKGGMTPEQQQSIESAGGGEKMRLAMEDALKHRRPESEGSALAEQFAKTATETVRFGQETAEATKGVSALGEAAWKSAKEVAEIAKRNMDADAKADGTQYTTKSVVTGSVKTWIELLGGGAQKATDILVDTVRAFEREMKDLFQKFDWKSVPAAPGLQNPYVPMSFDTSQLQRGLLQDAALRDGALLWSAQHGGVGAGSWGGGFLRTSYTGGRVPLGFGGGWGGTGGGALPGGGDYQGIISSLQRTESGGRWDATGPATRTGEQAVGRLQFMPGRIADYNREHGTHYTSGQVKSSPQIQMDMEQWHFQDIDRQIASRGLSRYIGTRVGGTVMTPNAMRAMAHLGGIGGLQRYLESGGQSDPGDGRTHLSDYARIHGGAPDTAPPMPAPSGAVTSSTQVQGTADVAVRVILDKDGRVASVEPPSRVRVPLTTGRSPHRGLA